MCNILCIIHIHVHLSSVNNASFHWTLNVILFNVYTYHKFINTAANTIIMNNRFSTKSSTRTVMNFPSWYQDHSAQLPFCILDRARSPCYQCITFTCNVCWTMHACVRRKATCVCNNDRSVFDIESLHCCRSDHTNFLWIYY